MQKSNALLIPLTKGYATKVSPVYFEEMRRFAWRAHEAGGLVYARRNATAAERRLGYPSTVYMHRQVMSLLLDMHIGVDHINHDGLDNRRENLRQCSKTQNNGNTRKTRGTSRYKGVWLHAPSRKWYAGIRKGALTVPLGGFHDEEEAARAYDRAALEYFGEYACLNFPA